MTLLGHGAMGVQSNLPTLEELLESSAADRRHVVELRPGILVSDWFVHSGTTYVAALQPIFDGRRLDVVGVETLLDTGLSRAESLADCIATAGTFFFDPDVDTTDAFIWDSTSWDDGKFWDRFPQLYVHLEAEGNPRDTQVLARVVFFMAGRGMVVPDLGVDKVSDGTFEGTWSGGAPPNWTKGEAGAATVSEETASPLSGDKSATIAVSGDGAGEAYVQKTLAVEVGAQYRVSGRYRVNVGAREGTSLFDGASFVGFWDLESDGSDLFGATALTKINAPPHVAAVHGKGLQFARASNQYAQSTSSDLNIGTDDAVMGLKVRVDAVTADNGLIAKGVNAASGGYVLKAFTSGALQVAVEDTGGTTAYSSATGALPNDGAFHTVVVVIDHAGAGTIKVYVDGVAVIDQALVRTGDKDTAATFYLGRTNGAERSDVTIDQAFLLKGRTWSAAEVAEYHAGTVGGAAAAWKPTEIRVQVGSDAAGWLSADGRSYGSEHGASLFRTGGQERAFCFDFVAHIAAPSLHLTLLGVGAASVTFDDVEVRRVWRWHFARPRLLAGRLPSNSQGQNDVFFGSELIGQGDLGLANGDGLIEQLLAAYAWVSAEVRVHQGGVMPDGRELPFGEYLRRFTGRVEDLPSTAVDDRIAELPLEDLKGLLHRDAPPNTYDLATFPGMIASKVGEARPVWWGPKTNVEPVRIIRDEDSGYGTYELADPSVGVAGIKAVSAVYAYTDETSAREKLTTRRLTLSNGTDYSVDLATARLSILRDVQVIEVTTEENLLDFDIGGSALLATLTPGLYTPATLAAEAETRLDAAAGVSDISVTYDEELHRFTVSKGAGTLNLLLDTGANAELSGWGVLGYDRSSDLSGSLSYQGNADPLFDREEDADRLHIIRVDGQGYKDDTSGTYTGTASAVISKGADLARFVWHRLMRQPLSRVNEASFAAARTSAPESLGAYLSRSTSTRDIFEALKASNLAQIVIDGEGRIYYVPYTSTVPSTAPVLRDRDFTEWGAGQPRADVHPEVVVFYGTDPTTGAVRERRATNTGVQLSAGRARRRELRTYLTADNDAQLLANKAQTLSAAQPIVADVTVPSRLARRKPGDFVKVTRTRGLGGPFTEEPFRIVWMRHERQTRARLVQNVEV